MKTNKSMLQQSSIILGVICFFLAVVCVIMLYFKVQELGMQHPVSASFLASSFFFMFIGVVFTVIGTADIPSFKVVVATPSTAMNKENG